MGIGQWQIAAEDHAGQGLTLLRRVNTADDAMVRITAERLVAHLRQSGFVLMKRPDAAAPSTSTHRHPNTD